MQNKDSRSRKWQITINNPAEKGYNHDYIKEQLHKFKSLVYWCMADEQGLEGTYHTHIYVAFSNAVRFSSVKKRFEGGHFEMSKGTSQQNKDYIFKQGKWEKNKKSETHFAETREEYGEIPQERQGERNDLNDLYDMIKQGLSNFEILEQNPSYMLMLDRIENVRQTFREEKYKNEFRHIFTTYVYGATETGKTRSIMEKYGYENVYRITDYKHPFDNYKGQDVIVFEEFRSSLRIQEMLNYLDGYPCELPCRYLNKIACFTKVYIISNYSLDMQYPDIRSSHKQTYDAFLRRVDNVRLHESSTSVQNFSMSDYVNSAHYRFGGFSEVDSFSKVSDIFN